MKRSMTREDKEEECREEDRKRRGKWNREKRKVNYCVKKRKGRWEEMKKRQRAKGSKRSK